MPSASSKTLREAGPARLLTTRTNPQSSQHVVAQRNAKLVKIMTPSVIRHWNTCCAD